MKLGQKLAINYIRARLNILALVSPKKAAKKAFDLFCTPRKKSRKDVPAVFASGENLSFRLEGHTVRGHRWLPAARPEKKVLIAHGFESTSKNFEQYIQALLKKNYEVLAFDAPAHGESGGKRITLPLYIKTLRIIYEDYGPIQSFMGHSFGGLAISHLLESIPHDRAAKLVLVAPPGGIISAVDSFFQLLQLSGEVRKAFDEYIYEHSGLLPEYFSMRRAMDHITASVLWLHDEDDRITPLKDALVVKEDQHDNLRFVITKGLGHRKIYRDPAIMEQIAVFL
jgi:pimeloyl-ACP methyl ester carboxylesterase